MLNIFSIFRIYVSPFNLVCKLSVLFVVLYLDSAYGMMCESKEEELTMERIFPPKLQKGDEVRVIAPSKSLGVVGKEDVEQAIKVLQALGLKVTFGAHIYERDEHQTSSVESRLIDLHTAFSDKKVKLVLAAFGGYSANQLLKRIDYELIARNPKIFCGFSDITALSNAIYRKTGLVTYSGPNFSSFGMVLGLEYTRDYFDAMFFRTAPLIVEPALQWSDDAWYLDQVNRTFHDTSGYWVINSGKAEGTVVGGNLGTWIMLHGTPYMPSLRGAIVFLEEVSLNASIDIKAFDRALQSLICQNDFSHVAGIVIGRFESKFGINRENLTHMLRDKPELKGVPIIANVDIGHTTPIFTFPIGGWCALEGTEESAKIQFLSH